MTLRSNILMVFSFLVCAAGLPALNLWRHPEIADKNALFVDAGMAPLIFNGLEFPILPLELRLDYLPPLSLPISIGLFMKTPRPNLKSFGTRCGYHFDLDDSKTDLYFVYVFDYGFIRNDILEKYNDTAVQIHRYDFRVGVRRFFGPFIGLAVESDFKVGGIIILLTAKIH
jgi:hypothetical protein